MRNNIRIKNNTNVSHSSNSAVGHKWEIWYENELKRISWTNKSNEYTI